MPHILIPLTLCLFLAACGSDEPADAVTVSSASPASSAQSSSVRPVLASSSKASTAASVPSHVEELGVEALADLPIVGSDFTVGQRLDTNAVYDRYFISYKSNGVKVTGIMNVPKAEGDHPLLVFNHGYIAPSVYTNGRGLKREQDYMARQGFAVVHIDYRGHAGSDPNPDNRPVASVYGYALDALTVVDAIRKNPPPRVNTAKVGMLGHSLGGGVSMLAGVTHPEFVDALALYAPISGSAYDNFDRWQADDRGGELVKQLFGTQETNPDFWNSLSPASYFDRLAVPVRIFHGTADKDVPYAWSEETLAAMKEAGTDAELVTYQNEGHEFGPRWTDFMKSAAEFFSRHLKS